jgi:hypothetical protein
MTTTDAAGRIGYVKPTTWMSSSIHMFARLRKRCANRGGGAMRRHVHLVGGRAAGAAIYPPKLRLAILRGTAKCESIVKVLNQIDDDESWQLYDEAENQVGRQEGDKVYRDENRSGATERSSESRTPGGAEVLQGQGRVRDRRDQGRSETIWKTADQRQMVRRQQGLRQRCGNTLQTGSVRDEQSQERRVLRRHLSIGGETYAVQHDGH